MSKRKSFDELKFTDDFMFAKTMRANPEMCKRVAEICIGKKISKIKYHETQKTMDLAYENKGIRMDVYFEDDEGTMYNVEMQNANLGNANRRARYYQSVMDLNSMEAGCDYDELPNSYIIFLCMFDPFKESRAKYEFKYRETTTPDLQLQDGSTIIFINPFGNFHDYPILDENGEPEKDIPSFFSLLRGEVLHDGIGKLIQDEVNKAMLHEEWRSEYMFLSVTIEDAKKQARKEGRAEGRAEERLSFIRNLIQSGVSDDIILNTGVTAEELEQAKKN